MEKLFKKESVSYLVVEKKSYINGWYFCGTLEECIDYVRNEIRNRNKNDGYDEFWHTVELMIVKRTQIDEDIGIKI